MHRYKNRNLDWFSVSILIHCHVYLLHYWLFILQKGKNKNCLSISNKIKRNETYCYT